MERGRGGRRARWVALGAIALAIGCGGSGARVEDGSGSGAPRSGGSSSGAEREGETARPASGWLGDVPRGGTLTYDVALCGAGGCGSGAGAATPRRVQMQVQEVVRRGSGIAVMLAPIGTPLDEEPVYPRWIVGEEGVLVGLDETASLTAAPGYAPIDESGRMVTEATENVAWRVPRDWLTPGRVIAGEEVSAGWRLAERIGDVEAPVAGRGCVRLEREEVGVRAAMLVCSNLGVIETTRTGGGGELIARWSLVAVDAARESGAEPQPLE